MMSRAASGTLDSLLSAADELLPSVIADRRYLHAHPELGFQEVETARMIAERLASLGVEEIRTGIAVTGVTGLIRGTASGPERVVLVRADMDALPIQEQNEVEYCSQHEGLMHACGHDAHVAMLLGVARLLMERREQFAGTVKLLFQPAEESDGGAEVMIAEGVLDDPPVDVAFGMHIDQDSPVGTIGYRAGPALAAVDDVEIQVRGLGGHGAHPEMAIDPVVISAAIVMALQTIVSREVDPTAQGVVTIGAIHAGEAANVIPESATMRGTLRSFDPAVRRLLASRVSEIAPAIAAAMRAEAAVTIEEGYPATVNDPAMTTLVRETAELLLGEARVRELPQIMGSEDFGFFLEQVPGCFFFVGSQNEEKGLVWGHHHPRFDIDEEAMATGMAVMTGAILRSLRET